MPLHHLHDGPPEPFFVSKFNAKPISSKPAASIAALSWAAEREGVSYGRFIHNLRPEDEARIQTEYDTWKGEKAREWEERQAARVDTDQGGCEGYIITDEDP